MDTPTIDPGFGHPDGIVACIAGSRAYRRAAKAYDCRISLYDFAKEAWPIVEPGVKYVDNWHVKVVCDHLQAVSEGKIRNLMICIPPGHMKSLITSVFWPSWEWADRPWVRSLYGSYDENLVFRDSIKARDIIKSTWYRKLFRPEWEIRKDVDSKSNYANTMHGSRKSYFIGSRFKTGWRGDGRVMDDPLSAEDRFDKFAKAKVIDSWEKVMSTRVNDPMTAFSVIIMQRLADDDLVGYLLKTQPDKYVYLMIPTEFDPERRCVTPIWTDKRTEKGELLFPAKYPREYIDDLKHIVLGEIDFEAQHNHNPKPEGGVRFGSEYFLYWKPVGVDGELIEITRRSGETEIIRIGLCETFVTVDVAVSEKQTSDYTVYLEWALTKRKDMILVGRHKARVTEPESIRMAKKIHEFRRHGGARHSYFAVEMNGVGTPLYQNLMEAGIPVKEIHVHRDKWAMSATASVRLRSGQIFFPSPAVYPWVHDFERVLTDFPNGQHDDDVSALCIAANAIFDLPSTLTGHASGNGDVHRKPDIERRANLGRRGMFGVRDTR